MFARNLAECLELQLIERDRFDPAMRALVDNLPLLAKRDLAALRRACGVDDEDLVDMIGEIKRLEAEARPRLRRPASRRRSPTSIVTAAPENWLAGRAQRRGAAARAGQRDLRRRIRRGAAREEDRHYISTQLQRPTG